MAVSDPKDIDTAEIRARLFPCPNEGCHDGAYPTMPDGEPEQCHWCYEHAEKLALCDAVDALRAENARHVELHGVQARTIGTMESMHDKLSSDLAARDRRVVELEAAGLWFREQLQDIVDSDYSGTSRYDKMCAEIDAHKQILTTDAKEGA